MVGSFPSNFVEVLPPDFVPRSRSTSPLPPKGSNTPSPTNTPQKTKTFRKPYAAYVKAPHYSTMRESTDSVASSPQISRENSTNSAFRHSVHETVPRQHVPQQAQVQGYGSRAVSPAPSFGYQAPQQHYRSSIERGDSPPPPAPPPHRHAIVSRHNSNASYDNRQDGYHTPRAPSPCPPSPGGSGLTPSPLREAMDGVIEQLDALGVPRDTESPEPPFDPWSPESFDMIGERSRRKAAQGRPQTAMGISRQESDEGYGTYSGESTSEQTFSQASGRSMEPPLPQLSNYVERMETRLRKMHQHTSSLGNSDAAPIPPPKSQPYERPKSSMDTRIRPDDGPRHQKSAHDLRRAGLTRTGTTKTNSTNSSSVTQSSHHTMWSGTSAGALSSTSAGSHARRRENRPLSAFGTRDVDPDRPTTPFSGVTYHSSHASDVRSKSSAGFHDFSELGGLVEPKRKKQNIFKKILESAKTGVASGRGTIGSSAGGPVQSSPVTRSVPNGVTAIAGGPSFTNIPRHGQDAAREMGLTSGVDWVQVRRDVNRSNSLSGIERIERKERCQILDYPAINPCDELWSSVDGDEGIDGMPVREPTNYHAINLSQVDKNSRFITNLPPLTTAITLATTYVCRPYRSDVQRLRAIFTWVSERICWEEDFDGQVDTRRVVQSRRGCAEEYAVLTCEMCMAVGIKCEVIRGYLKTPGEIPETGIMPRSNHWWNAVLIENEWRMMDCCLASPSNPRRSSYSSAGSSVADFFWFLTRPTELCWTHIPEHHSQQHICPPVAHEILLNLPCVCPPYFRNNMEMYDYNTSLTRIEDLEMVHIKFNVPPDVEVAAEVEVRTYTRDSDGDFYVESGETVKKRALAQAEWFGGVKRYTVKALLPGDEGSGVLKVYAGKRGLMHSIKDIPHPLAFALPILHSGENPPYEFVTRHPTPHAQRHDIYVVQPQCQRLALNNTFVFAVRQHPSSPPTSVLTPSSNPGGTSPVPFARPSSALSMTSSSAAGSNPSTTNSGTSGSVSGSSSSKKPAKLAIQTPGGKILRLMRKEEKRGAGGAVGIGSGRVFGPDEEVSDGTTWETIIKCSERGVWRGLVLADRTARWCVFAEWVCVG